MSGRHKPTGRIEEAGGEKQMRTPAAGWREKQEDRGGRVDF